MSEKRAVYKCPECGLVIEVINPGAEPVCCGRTMQLMHANTADAAKEKHVPEIENFNGKVKVRVGSVAHPMTAEHYITLVAVETNQGYQVKELTPDSTPEAVFSLSAGEKVEAVYAYCNLHGLWKA